MVDFREIYRERAEVYDALVRFEDVRGALIEVIRGLVSLDGIEVVELGAGTGRVTLQLAPWVRRVRAYDRESAMLDVARRHVDRLGIENCVFEVADNAQLPAADRSAQLAIAGWTFGHQTVWHEQHWRAPIEAALGEMLRVLSPGGTAIVIETLGTGHTEPFEPPEMLGRYYAMLEQDYGFTRQVVRTDFELPSMDEAERLFGAFFGPEAARDVVARGSTTVPECTGVWWLRR